MYFKHLSAYVNAKWRSLSRRYRIQAQLKQQLATNNNNDNNNSNRKIVAKLSNLQIINARSYKKKGMEALENVFIGVEDRYHGISIYCCNYEISDKEFTARLETSLALWKREQIRTVWFYVHTAQANWVPILTKFGFDFHHAKFGLVVLYKWLPTKEPINLPASGHTLLGVGGLVINAAAKQILAVSDRHAIVPNSWKLPGGYVEPGEDITSAAIREVQEETGIRTAFRSLVALRHSHGGNFGCSDLYVVAALTPKNLKIQRCEREITRARWMDIEEFLQHPQVHETNRGFVRTYLDYQRRGIVMTAQKAIHQILKKEYNLYFIKSAAVVDDDEDVDKDKDEDKDKNKDKEID